MSDISVVILDSSGGLDGAVILNRVQDLCLEYRLVGRVTG